LIRNVHMMTSLFGCVYGTSLRRTFCSPFLLQDIAGFPISM
jgi:hypothetical protein